MRRALLASLLWLALFQGAPVSAGEAPAAPPGWPAAAWKRQVAYEGGLQAVPTTGALARWHEAFCAEPHPAGSAAARRLAEQMLETFRSMGLETVHDELEVFLPVHEDAYVEVLDGRHRHMLRLHEDLVPQDASVREHVPPAFNAYSGSGTATGQVVYANYGTKEDFAQLRTLGVSCRDKIVIARYGRNFRGFKARYAQAAGAVGLVLYTDPEDSGYRKGLPYPRGGYANGSSIQRGSIKALAYPGDPLTPFTPAHPGAERLDPEQVALPSIPVQPIGWRAAQRILEPMAGPEVPGNWQGGLPFRYRLTGGPALRVQVMVKQPRALARSSNVLGLVRGREHPDELVIVGCHFDAWTFGAGDPHAGSIVLFEIARSFAGAAKGGDRPARTVVFANWGAEEYGIIGSTEWCEANAQALGGHAVAYVNLDMAAMGPNFGSAAAPALKSVIEQATRAVPQARTPQLSVHTAWAQRGGGVVSFGNLGGGSDHVGFYCHLGVPSCSLGASGARGVSYHTAYDTLAWYRQVVGDYEPALMLARVGSVLIARLANAPLVPYDLARPLADARRHLDTMFGAAAGDQHPAQALGARLADLATKAAALQARLETAVREGALAGEGLTRANETLLALERAWLRPQGLPQRPWYRNLYAASDPGSGYAAWMLPLLRQASEGDVGVTLGEALEAHGRVLDRIEGHHAALRAHLGG